MIGVHTSPISDFLFETLVSGPGDVGGRSGSVAASQQFITWAAGYGCDFNRSMQHLHSSTQEGDVAYGKSTWLMKALVLASLISTCIWPLVFSPSTPQFGAGIRIHLAKTAFLLYPLPRLVDRTK